MESVENNIITSPKTNGQFKTNASYEIFIPSANSMPTFFSPQKGKSVTVFGETLVNQFKTKDVSDFFKKNPLKNVFQIFQRFVTPNYTWYIVEIKDNGDKSFIAQGTFIPANNEQSPQRKPPVSRRVQPSDGSPLNDGDYRDEAGRYATTPQTSYNAMINEKNAYIDELKRQIAKLESDKQEQENIFNQRYASMEVRIKSAEESREHYRQVYEGSSEKIINAEREKSDIIAQMRVLEEKHKSEIERLKIQHEQEKREIENEMQEAAQTALNDELEKKETPLNKLADVLTTMLSQPTVSNLVTNFIANKLSQYAPPHPGGVPPGQLAQAQITSAREDLLQAAKEGRLTQEQFASLAPADQQWLQYQIQMIQQQYAAQQNSVQQQYGMSPMNDGADEYAEAMA